MAQDPASIDADIAVLGSGPGGYTAAFRAADLGKKVVLIERYPTLGGVCLNVGCIPSKAFLHAAKVLSEANEIKECGIDFGKPNIDTEKLRKWVMKVISQLTGGLAGLAHKRGVQVVSGYGQFTSAHQINVVHDDTVTRVNFSQAIIAAGSQAAKLPFIPEDSRVLDSTSALELKRIPKRMLVVGGGIIGLELATVYHELGTSVTIVEVLDRLVSEADPDLVKPLESRISSKYERIMHGTRVTSVDCESDMLSVQFEKNGEKFADQFDNILVAVGRQPNGAKIGVENASVRVSDDGFIAVDRQMRTNIANIFAIGDIVGQPMLAHKAVHQGKVAAEVAAGLKAGFDTDIIPSVAYTDPEIAWAGLTENEAKRKGVEYEKSSFPWAASGRALSTNRSEGLTKLLFEPTTNRVIGAGMTGPNAGELIAEAMLAIEMGADAQDLALTIHPHPTLSETIGFAAEMQEGTITDLYMPKRKPRRK